MTSLVPRLDNTDFAELVEESRGQIPRYAPEWTDHNLHDPGMTLIDLLAWIVDQQIYRVGFVGDGHLQAFAALLGRRRSGPVAASGLVWPDGPLETSLELEPETELICLRQPRISFVLERRVLLSKAVLTEALFAVGGIENRIDLTHRSDLPFELPVGEEPPTALTIMANAPLTEERPADISVGFEVASPPGPPANDDSRWGPLRFEYRVGKGAWRQVKVDHDGTNGLSTTGVVTLNVPGPADQDPVQAAGDDPQEAELRLLLAQGFFAVPPRIHHIAVNVLPVKQLEVQKPQRRFGTGTALPDQAYELDTVGLTTLRGTKPVSPLRVTVAEEEWVAKTSFENSGPDDHHYVRRNDRIEFGNGLNGSRPGRGDAIGHDGFVLTKGAAGNLQAGLDWSIPVLDQGHPYGRNPASVTGGLDADSPETLIEAARAAANHRQVLLTDDDLRRAALELPGLALARAEVLPRFDRRVPEGSIDGVRTLVVVPHRDPATAAHPVEQAYLDAVAFALEQRRVLGERLVVQRPQVKPVNVVVTVQLEPGAVASDVERLIEQAITHRLSDLPRSEDVEPWPLGRTVTTQEMKRIVAVLPGVATVPLVQIGGPDAAPGQDPISIARDAVAVGTVNVQWASAASMERSAK